MGDCLNEVSDTVVVPTAAVAEENALLAGAIIGL